MAVKARQTAGKKPAAARVGKNKRLEAASTLAWWPEGDAAGRGVHRGMVRAYRAGMKRAEAGGWAHWVRTYQDRVAVAAGCWFCEETARHYAEFFPAFLRHSKGEKWGGQPFELLPWQRDNVVMPLFGWKRADGTRRYRNGSIWVPKKNGKSTLGAGIGICLLVVDGEPGAEVYTGATKQDQARMVWREAAAMVKKSPELRKLVQVHDHVSTINMPATLSFMKALSADGAGIEGANIHGLIRDELHVWTDREFWNALRYGGAARTQPLALSISTAGDDISGLGYEEYIYACQVRDGAVDDWEYLALVYEAGPDDDIEDPAVWAKANPSLGVTFDAESMASTLKAAREKPSELSSWKRYRLNMWGQRLNPWIDIGLWDKAGRGKTEGKPREARGAPR